MSLRAIQRPGFWVGIVSIVMFLLLKKLEEAIPELVGGAVLIGGGFALYGVNLILKNKREVKTRSPEKWWLGIELVVVGIMVTSPFLLLLLAISYLEALAYWILVAAWLLLFADLLLEKKLGPARA